MGGGAIGTFANASVTGSTFTDNLAQAGDGGVAPANAPSPGMLMGGAIVDNSGYLHRGSERLRRQSGRRRQRRQRRQRRLLHRQRLRRRPHERRRHHDREQQPDRRQPGPGGSRATAGPDLGFIGDANGGGFAGFGAAVFTDSTFDDNTAVSGRAIWAAAPASTRALPTAAPSHRRRRPRLFRQLHREQRNDDEQPGHRRRRQQGRGDPAGVLVGTATGGGLRSSMAVRAR